MVNIGLNQLLRNSAMCEHRCLENINKLYKSSVKIDNKQNYKYMIESVMVPTTKEITNNIAMDIDTSENLKNPSARE